jgi:AAA+ superfamily predicted ATPase
VLLVHGLRPARKLLFTGQPGVGKTMAAGALARAIGLPLFRVELHEVIASHLGETAGKLAKVFDHVRTMPAVYLFDEFDAIGSDRSALSDGSSAGAEMRRVVNSLLQFVEDDRSDGLIIAATNHEQMLDGAIFRRFDETIAFAIPSREELVELVRRSLVESNLAALDYAAIYAAAANPGLGHADVCAALDRVLKDHFLVGTPIDTARVVAAFARRSRTVRPEATA